MPLANSDRPGLPKEGGPAIKLRPDPNGVPQAVLGVEPPLFPRKTLKSGLDSHFLVRTGGKIWAYKGHDRTIAIEHVGEGSDKLHMQEEGASNLTYMMDKKYQSIHAS